MDRVQKRNIPAHMHPAYFGSELACKICNPFCYMNHGMGKLVGDCGHPNCPLKIKRGIKYTIPNEVYVG